MDELLNEMTAAEIREWEAFEALEPFGQAWDRTALIAALIANANRDPEKRSEPFEQADFMPRRMELEPDEAEALEELNEMDDVKEAAHESMSNENWKDWKMVFKSLAEASKSVEKGNS